MSDVPVRRISDSNMMAFAVVVDGEVAFAMRYPQEAENAVAALSSDPQIVLVPEELKTSVVAGWTFDGVDFIPPTE